ncbi:MAG TPA: DUF5602 domain-containing protein [Pseudonocardia sp.]|uniref:DUF5602 domain-containing protein n=1 Tax=Pseudonocardia sp. TaxID=60912 RepID=UPI002ED7FCD9
MVIKFQRGRVRASALCILVLALTGGCGQQRTEGQAATRPPDIYFGASQAVGNGTAKTFVKPDPSGQPAEVGLVMSASSMDGLAAEDTVPPTMVMLGFPPEAKATVFDHVMMNWNSHGHKPAEVFGKPHFDFHFYLSDAASVMAIDPGGVDFAAKAARLPDARYMPQDYAADPGLPAANTVPAMGLHWVDSTARIVPGEYQFTQIFINGSWDGQYTFMEPMLTREWMLTHPTVREAIKQPAAYQHDGYYPHDLLDSVRSGRPGVLDLPGRIDDAARLVAQAGRAHRRYLIPTTIESGPARRST